MKITLQGNDVAVAGKPVEVGQKAPAFSMKTPTGEPVTLESHSGKKRIIAAVPSLDTPVCNVEMIRFNQEAAELDAVVICASTDLPFAQKRWCGAVGASNLVLASDHLDTNFGEAYGCLIQGGPLQRCHARAIFVIDEDDTLKHVEYVSDIAKEPDYDAALSAVRG